MEDFRIKTSWRSHRKRRRLKRLLGAEGVLAIEDIWSYCAAERPDGDLTGLTNQDIADEADYDGDADELVRVLCEECQLIGGISGMYRIHDWEDHNPYVATGDSRSEAGKKNAHKRWHVKRGVFDDSCEFCRLDANPSDGNANNANPNAPSSHPSIPPSFDERETAESEKIETLEQLESAGFKKYGQAVTKAALLRPFLPILRHEFEDASGNKGKSWEYFAKVLRTNREHQAQGPPPGAQRKKYKAKRLSIIEQEVAKTREERNA